MIDIAKLTDAERRFITFHEAMHAAFSVLNRGDTLESLIGKVVRVKLTAETGKLVGGYVTSTGTIYLITTPLRTLEVEVPRDAEITDYLEEIIPHE